MPDTEARQPGSTGLRVIAAFEAAKGLLVLLAGCGLLALLHRDLQALGNRLVEHLHLNPAARYPQIFLHAVGTLDDARLWMLAAGAGVYAALRGVEAYGLWRQRRWAEWMGVLSGAVYLPFEIRELVHGVTMLKVSTFALNLLVVAWLAHALRRRAARAAASARAV